MDTSNSKTELESKNEITNIENSILLEIKKDHDENQNEPSKINTCLKKKGTKRLLLATSLLIIGLIATFSYLFNKIGGL